MNRRHFLKALGAVAAGVALKAVPVVGEQFSELTVPSAYTVGAPSDYTLTMADFEKAVATLRANAVPGDYVVALTPAQRQFYQDFMVNVRYNWAEQPLDHYGIYGWQVVTYGPCRLVLADRLRADGAQQLR